MNDENDHAIIQSQSPNRGFRIKKRWWIPAVALTGAFLIWWNFFHTVSLSISTQTTRLTAPLTSDGKHIDYAAAIQLLDPPELATDDNGARLLVSKLGTNAYRTAFTQSPEYKTDFYSALGLKPDDDVQSKRVGLIPALRVFLRNNRSTASPEMAETAEMKPDDKMLYLSRSVPFSMTQGEVDFWKAERHEFARQFCEQNAETYDLYAKAVRAKCFQYPVRLNLNSPQNENKGSFTEFDYGTKWMVQTFRTMAAEIRFRALYRIETGDLAGATADIETLQLLSNHLLKTQLPSTATDLYGISLSQYLMAIPLGNNKDHQPTKEQWQRLLDLSMKRAVHKDRYTIFNMDRLYHGLAIIDNMSQNDPRKELQSLPGMPPCACDRLVGIDWNAVAQEYNHCIDDFRHAENLENRDALFPRMIRFRQWLRGLLLGSRSREVGLGFFWSRTPSLQPFREAWRYDDCTRNLYHIMLAMQLYRLDHGTWPPAFTIDDKGKPLLGWPVLLLPYLGYQDLYAKIKLDEPWDGPNNSKLHQEGPEVFVCESCIQCDFKTGKPQQSGLTSYSVIVGENAPFDLSGKGKKYLLPGSSQILVSETRQARCWMMPDEGISAKDAEQKGIFSYKNHDNNKVDSLDDWGSFHADGVNVALTNGIVVKISNDSKTPIPILLNPIQ